MQGDFINHCPIDEAVESGAKDLEEIVPLIEYLQGNIPVTEPVRFPRGTMMPDGRLDLCKQGIGVTGCQQITDVLRANTTVISLLLGTDGIGDVGASAVAKLIQHNSHLEVVYLGCNQITKKGAAQLAAALSLNTSVTGLWLKRNPIGRIGAEYLAEMLSINKSIRTLDLVNTHLEETGLNRILDVLIDKNRTVERLYLGGNQIYDQAAKRLSMLLKTNPNIKYLFLNVNHLGDVGAIELADGLRQNSTLIELGVASNGITSTGGMAILEAIEGHPSLVNLDLGYSPSTQVLAARANSLGAAGAERVGKLLANDSNLLRLNLRGNGITEQGKMAIIEGLEKNYRLQHLILDGKLEPQIKALLERNRNLNSSDNLLPRDVALIRSVYRTK
ncbi:hypothetical protein [Gloeothece verrucosa]|uniref:Leucine-rich repeat, ribonuclease inhibitor subtype n=1 Tax=Gloeothece verrucosa (strain PCC 7822) TaxID=497965 RepID=E0UHH8_GLOV7|nr:hypothetical protein [Gloeothece verrucosa]ADN12119.1 leucine-rich repeat, ribonuclease inhibitor subtype [Gloeothece verrucosa PCC 7822]